MGTFLNLFDRTGIVISPTFILIVLFGYLLYKIIPIYKKINDKIEDLDKVKNSYDVTTAKLDALTAKIDVIDHKVQELQRTSDESEMAKAQQLLVGMYNKYVPLGKWTKLESDTFWRIFRDYESRGGNGYMHSIVQPAMEKLEITEEY